MTLILVLFFQISPVGRFFTGIQDSSVTKGIFISPGFEMDTVNWFLVHYGGKFSLTKNLYMDIKVFFKHGNDSTYPFYNWHDIGEMDYTRALLGYRTEKIRFSMGLDSPTLSRGNFTKLFFDGFEPEFPQIQFLFKGKQFRFFYLAGQMEEVRSNPFKPTGDTKYFAFHEIRFRWKNFEFKFGEGVLFKSFNGTHPDWYLFTPVSIWYPRQANSNRTDMNIAWLFGADLKVSENSTLYGEFFIDDAPYRRAVDENPRVGGLAGFDKNGDNWRFITESAFVTRYTYSYYPDRLELSWFYNSYPLGTITGTDFVKFSSFIKKNGKISPFGYLEILLQGDGVMGEPFEVGNLSKKVLLSGKVRKIFRMEAGLAAKSGKFGFLVRAGLLAGDESQLLAGATVSYSMR